MASGVIGSPQPEAAPFQIPGSSTNGGTAALEADGSFAIAYQNGAGIGATRVCHLLRAARSCASLVTLQLPDPSQDQYATPEVFAPSPGVVEVLLSTSTTPAGDLLFTSTNGGASFGAAVPVGTIGTIGAATVVGGTLVFTEGDDTHGLRVETAPVVGASGVPTPPVAIDPSNSAYDVGLGTASGGVLLGSDVLGSSYTTTVRFAPQGSDPGTAGSYNVVGTFPGEQLLGISGNAVLTQRNDAKSTVLLRLFTGSGLTAPTVVPGGAGGGPEWFGVTSDPAGRAHVFAETGRNLYNAYQVITADGVHWSAPQFLGNAILSNGFSAALDSAGTGILLGTGSSSTASVFPILNGQHVVIALKKRSIRRGTHTTLSGSVSPAFVGLSVQLQYQKGAKWYPVANTHEKAGGKFSFTVKATAIGKIRYRAVASDRLGFNLFGYSNVATLTRTR